MEQLKALFDKPANMLVPVLLFILLSPGLLVTLGGEGQMVKFMPNMAMLKTVGIHAAVFLVLYGLLRTLFAQYY